MTLESKVARCAIVAIGGNISAWEATTAYIVGDNVIPITVSVNGHKYIVATGDDGTSDATEPVWPTDPGDTIIDGTVTWTEDGVDADKIAGAGSWGLSGGAYAELDDTEFCDNDMKFERGVRSGQDVSFDGNYKSDDTNGQDILWTAFYGETNLTDLRFYDGLVNGVKSYSYWAPNQSILAGGKLPADMPLSHIKLMSPPAISADKGDLQKISFAGKVQGVMRYYAWT